MRGGSSLKTDYTNKKFGKISVVKRVDNDELGVRWECLCACGNTFITHSYRLKANKIVSCGCIKQNRHIRKPVKHKESGDSAFAVLYSTYKFSAKSRGFIFELTEEQFKTITKLNCYYCDSSPYTIQKDVSKSLAGNYIYNGIDRVENTKGYSLDNCVACCRRCNTMKMAIPFEDFKEHIIKIALNLQNK